MRHYVCVLCHWDGGPVAHCHTILCRLGIFYLYKCWSVKFLSSFIFVTWEHWSKFTHALSGVEYFWLTLLLVVVGNRKIFFLTTKISQSSEVPCMPFIISHSSFKATEHLFFKVSIIIISRGTLARCAVPSRPPSALLLGSLYHIRHHSDISLSLQEKVGAVPLCC